MSHKLIIQLSDAQKLAIQKHLSEEAAINQVDETLSGWTFTLSCTEFGIHYLGLEMNTKIELGEVEYTLE